MEHGEGSSTGGTTTMTGPMVDRGNTTSQPAGEFGVQINNGFSSKGLADFKPGNTESVFKSFQELSHQKPLIDISKPVSNQHTEEYALQHDYTKSEFNIEIKPHEKNSIFKDIHSFEKPQSMIDINKPVREEPVEISKPEPQYHEKEEVKTKQSEERFVSYRPDLEVQKEQFDTSNEGKEKALQQAYEAEEEPDVQFDREQKTGLQTDLHEVKVIVNTDPEVVVAPQVHAKTGAEVSLQTKSDTVAQIKAVHLAETKLETEVLQQAKTEAITKPLTKVEVEAEVVTAQETLAAALAQQEKASLTKAREAIATVVRQDEASKQQREPESQPKKEQEKKEKTLEEKAKEMVLKRKKEKQEFKNSIEQDEDGILYFDKDNEVNTYREMAAIAAAERLNINGNEVTGIKLAEVVANQIEEGKGSEIVKGIQDDESGKAVVESIAKMGKIENSWTLRRTLRQITDKYTAVKLVSESQDGAGKSNAENVYGRDLDGVGARFEEENSTGQMKELENGQIVYITQKPPEPLPVAPGEISQSY